MLQSSVLHADEAPVAMLAPGKGKTHRAYVWTYGTTSYDDTLHEWLTLHRQRATDGTAIARASDYSLARWAALVRFVDDGDLPIDNNHIENRIRPIALGRSSLLFAGSLRGGDG